MNPKLDLNSQNMVTVMMVQALLGAISPNFRQVALSLAEPSWQLFFVLEREDETDREEIEDVVAEFFILLLDMNLSAIRFETQVVINTEPLAALDNSLWRIVFLRREI